MCIGYAVGVSRIELKTERLWCRILKIKWRGLIPWECRDNHQVYTRICYVQIKVRKKIWISLAIFVLQYCLACNIFQKTNWLMLHLKFCVDILYHVDIYVPVNPPHFSEPMHRFVIEGGCWHTCVLPHIAHT